MVLFTIYYVVYSVYHVPRTTHCSRCVTMYEGSNTWYCWLCTTCVCYDPSLRRTFPIALARSRNTKYHVQHGHIISCSLFTLHEVLCVLQSLFPMYLFSLSQVLFTLFSYTPFSFAFRLVHDFARYIVSTSRADGWRVVLGLGGLQITLHVHALDTIAQKHCSPKPCHSDRNTNFRCKLHDVQVNCRCRNCCPAALDRGALTGGTSSRTA